MLINFSTGILSTYILRCFLVLEFYPNVDTFFGFNSSMTPAYGSTTLDDWRLIRTSFLLLAGYVIFLLRLDFDSINSYLLLSSRI